MGGFASGVADAMVESRTRSAESNSAFAAADALQARRMTALAKGETEQWKERAERSEANANFLCGEASGALITLNAVVKVMSKMPAIEREKFRLELATLARQRMEEVDRERKELNVRGIFKDQPANKILGIV